MQNSEEVCLLTPDRWNTHNEAYAINEDNMLVWEGNMIEKGQRTQILLSNIFKDDAMMAAPTTISAIESNPIDQLLERSGADSEEIACPCWNPILGARSSINPTS